MNNDSQLDALLKQVAEDHRPQLPSPSLVWWRAQIQRKQQQQERIERPMKIMRMVAAVAGLVVLATLIAANQDALYMLWRGGNWFLLAPAGMVIVIVSLVVVSLRRPAAKGR